MSQSQWKKRQRQAKPWAQPAKPYDRILLQQICPSRLDGQRRSCYSRRAWAMRRAKYHRLPWSHAAITEIPRDMRGLYAIWYRVTGKCVYVGQASRRPLRDRLREHWRNPSNHGLGLWISAYGDSLELCYSEVEPGRIDRLERRLIRLWHPETNVTHNQRLPPGWRQGR